MTRHHVEYMIIGGYAVNLHGFPRLTHDIDFFVSASIENQKRLIESLIEFGFPKSSLGTTLFTSDKTILRFGIAPNRVEIFSEIPGVTWEECWSSRIQSPIDGTEINWIGLAELRKNKAACHRAKDLLDLEELPKS